MKNKILSINIILIFIFTSLISVNAAAPSPRVDLNDYELTVTDINNVYISGTVNTAKGQNIGLFDSTGKVPLSYTTVKNTGSLSSFKIHVPSFVLKNKINTFKVISLPVRGVLNASSPKTFTVKLNSSKKDQTITANDISVKVNEKKSINAKVNSNLSLTYKSNDPSIATVNANGIVVGRKLGSTTIEISQGGNIEYNPTTKTINVTVTNNTDVKQPQTIKTGFDKYQFAGTNKSVNLGAKASSGLACTYKSSKPSIVSVDNKGKLTAKKAGTTKITITQPGNSNFKAATKTVTVKVPSINSKASAVTPLLDACKAQAKWMKNYSYGHWKPVTIANTKKHGTCVTYVGVALQRANLLKNKQYVWHTGSGFGTGKLSGSYGNSVKNNFKVTYIKNKKLKTMKKDLQPGDVLMVDDNRSGNKGGGGHIFIYTGKYSGNNPIIWDNGSCSRVKKGKAGQHAYSGNRKLRIILRPNTYNINTTCINGNISDTHMYLAGQKATISYSPMSGKKIKSIKVDGQNVNINKHKNSYTFNNLNKNHTITVVFN